MGSGCAERVARQRCVYIVVSAQQMPSRGLLWHDSCDLTRGRKRSAQCINFTLLAWRQYAPDAREACEEPPARDRCPYWTVQSRAPHDGFVQCRAIDARSVLLSFGWRWLSLNRKGTAEEARPDS